MKTILSYFIILLTATVLFLSCSKDKTIINNIYIEKVVKFNAKRFLLNQNENVLASLKGATMSVPNETSSFEWPEYAHNIPTTFTAYFIATTGSDQGTIIKQLDNLNEGDYDITIQARPYMVVVTNYDIKSKLTKENNRRWLPEKSNELYLYGESAIDYSQVDNGSVTVKNYYAAVMVLKNDIVQSIPSISGVSFSDVGDYYLLYAKDQNDANPFTRDIQLKAKSRDGNTIDYNLNGVNLSVNKENRFMLKLYDETSGEGNFSIIVDKDILKESIDTEVIVNR